MDWTALAVTLGVAVGAVVILCALAVAFEGFGQVAASLAGM